MQPRNPNWQPPPDHLGATPSERYLATVARRAFLSLWSHANVYTDEGRPNGKGDGKELCDLLVVFGDHVVLFSDKHCEFKPHADAGVAWSRWYRRAIEKSVRQLLGAESFLRTRPGRLFLDKSCTQPIPFALPDPDSARYHLVAATRGSHEAAVKYWNQESSGSYVIRTDIEGDAHTASPFQIGWPAGRKHFVHVLDDMALDVLLDELGTIADFIHYLEAKEAFLSQPDMNLIAVSGEEELVALYMATSSSDEHVFPRIPDGGTALVIKEGRWKQYLNSPQRAAKKAAEVQSFKWDEMIEYQAGFIRSGAAFRPIPGISDDAISSRYADHERLVRAMADESRWSRRILQNHMQYAFSVNTQGKAFTRMAQSTWRPSRFYVFLALPDAADESVEARVASRFGVLLAYCQGLPLRFPNAKQVVGIASAPTDGRPSSHEFVVLDVGEEPLSNEENAALQEALDKMGLFQEETLKATFGRPEAEFPIPFFTVPVVSLAGSDRAPLSRSDRRAQAAAARKKKPR